MKNLEIGMSVIAKCNLYLDEGVITDIITNENGTFCKVGVNYYPEKDIKVVNVKKQPCVYFEEINDMQDDIVNEIIGLVNRFGVNDGESSTLKFESDVEMPRILYRHKVVAVRSVQVSGDFATIIIKNEVYPMLPSNISLNDTLSVYWALYRKAYQ